MDVRLADLDPEWIRYERRSEGGVEREYYPHTYTMAQADGVAFLCPKCFRANGGRRGTHMVICWFRGRVPDGVAPGPGRWTPSGTGFNDLTFVPGVPARATSVKIDGGCGWHGNVVGGVLTGA